jgi:hypothetical protein
VLVGSRVGVEVLVGRNNTVGIVAAFSVGVLVGTKIEGEDTHAQADDKTITTNIVRKKCGCNMIH